MPNEFGAQKFVINHWLKPVAWVILENPQVQALSKKNEPKPARIIAYTPTPFFESFRGSGNSE